MQKLALSLNSKYKVKGNFEDKEVIGVSARKPSGLALRLNSTIFIAK